MANIKHGIKLITANDEKPACVNWYNANKNRRKSNNTLPPFSREYVIYEFVIYLA